MNVSIRKYEGKESVLELRGANLLAALELLDVVNLWVGEAVVDLDPLHGDILLKDHCQ